jgi:hypothetical protein
VWAVDGEIGRTLLRDDRRAPARHEEGEQMPKGSARTSTTAPGKVGDIQFAGARGGKIDWRSRPASALGEDVASKRRRIERRMERGLLLDGLRKG